METYENHWNTWPISFSNTYLAVFTHSMGSTNGNASSDGIYTYEMTRVYVKTSNTSNTNYGDIIAISY